jgi:hypothetical protein
VLTPVPEAGEAQLRRGKFSEELTGQIIRGFTDSDLSIMTLDEKVGPAVPEPKVFPMR